ncbi:hypothetical protein M0R89_12555 [Halorussus limi]|uniref:Halobacterial output domain-containing protein n=1 Tax=Halorussus limi TaxID=2938695 RepID=A0A8U0HRS6_9EURY|nr:HalOD1 output domain-containing protein [Halorussus limi]UPV73374.1 hypothetical protein M0R89_12555 [Halorussus limi]
MPDEATPDTGRSTGEDSPTYEYNPDEDETVIESVLHAVEAATDTRLLPSSRKPGATAGRERVRPLHDVVDPEALARLSSAATEVRVTFPYAGCTVTVAGTDAVLVTEESPP